MLVWRRRVLLLLLQPAAAAALDASWVTLNGAETHNLRMVDSQQLHLGEKKRKKNRSGRKLFRSEEQKGVEYISNKKVMSDGEAKWWMKLKQQWIDGWGDGKIEIKWDRWSAEWRQSDTASGTLFSSFTVKVVVIITVFGGSSRLIDGHKEPHVADEPAVKTAVEVDTFSSWHIFMSLAQCRRKRKTLFFNETFGSLLGSRKFSLGV